MLRGTRDSYACYYFADVAARAVVVVTDGIVGYDAVADESSVMIPWVMRLLLYVWDFPQKCATYLDRCPRLRRNRIGLPTFTHSFSKRNSYHLIAPPETACYPAIANLLVIEFACVVCVFSHLECRPR